MALTNYIYKGEKTMRKIFEKLVILLLILFLVITLLPTNYVRAEDDDEEEEEETTETTGFTADKVPYDLELTEISAGMNFTVAIDKKGKLWAWGNNEYGQLGTEEEGNKAVPTEVKVINEDGSEVTKFTKISTGDTHTMAIDGKGNLWTWGNNDKGQLGYATTDATSSNPQRVIITKEITTEYYDESSNLVQEQEIVERKFIQVSAGGSHSMAIDEDGNLWVWGDNTYGQIGNGSTTSSTTPVQITLSAEETFRQVSAGQYHSMAIDVNGNLYAWGYNRYGQVGNATTTNKNVPVQIKKGLTFRKISAGESHSLAIDMSGNLWAWGLNNYGQVGNKSTTNRTSPVQIKKGLFFTEISAGASHSMAVDDEGQLWAWGNNENARLGDPSLGIDQMAKEPIDIKYGTIFTKIAAGGAHSFGLDTERTLWGWGENEFGQVGSGTNKDEPTQILGKVITQISTGNYHNIALDSNGKVWTWGRNNYGQLGNGLSGDRNNSNDAIQITVGTGGTITEFKYVSAGANYCMAIDENGGLWAWGQNNYGQLGDNTKVTKKTPVQIEASIRFEKVSAGTNHTLAIDEDGNLYAWGQNNYGQLGKGDTKIRIIPNQVEVSGGIHFKEVSAGKYHSMAIDEDGNLWTWGYNADGRLGNGLTGTKKSPIQIKAGTQFKAISAGDSHSMAIDEDGNLWGWGKNDYGKLGDGTTKTKKEPTQIGTVKFKEVSAGQKHTIAVQDDDGDNSLWVAGYNNYGELGDGTKITRKELTKLSIGRDFKAASTGINFSSAINNDGKLFMWGNSKYGVLGTGEVNTYVKKPSQITEVFYTVTFKNGVEVLAQERVQRGGSASIPDEIEQAGYTIVWYEDCTNVTQDMVVNALWTPNTDTEYLVEHYIQNETLDDYGPGTYDVDFKTGTTGQIALARVKIIPGFTYSLSNKDTQLVGLIAGDGSLVLKLFYDRNEYSVMLNATEGTINSGNVTKYVYGVEQELPTDVTREGFTFEGWYDNEGNKVERIGAGEIGHKVYFARWKATQAAQVYYKVEHYLQNTELNGYDLIDPDNIDEIETTVGSLEVASPRKIRGFQYSSGNENNKVAGVVPEEGQLVLKAYYDRNKYDVEFDTDEGKIRNGKIAYYTYGIETELPKAENMSKIGYTFAGWYDNEQFDGDAITKIDAGEVGSKKFYAKWDINKYNVTFKDNNNEIETQVVAYAHEAEAPNISKDGYTLSWDREFDNVTENMIVNAVWTPRNDTQYIVEYYTQNRLLTGYDVDQVVLQGTTDDIAIADAKEIPGFRFDTANVNNLISGPIEGDGSLVLKLYYTRNTYQTVFYTDGGTINNGNITSYVYGSIIELPTDVTKQGYTFAGWYDNDKLAGNRIIEIGVKDLGDKIYYAKWEPKTDTNYQIEYYLQNEQLDDYVCEDIQILQGTTGELAIATMKEFPGFTYKLSNSENILSERIKADGSLVLKIYYDRNVYDVYLDSNEGTIKSGYVDKYVYGIGAQLPTNVTREGYKFYGWCDIKGNKIDRITEADLGNKTYYAKWIPDGEVPYRVEYYKQNDTLDLYYLDNIDNLTGMAGKVVTANIKEEEGFTYNVNHPNNLTTGNINSDGSLVLKVYYTRNVYDVNLNTNEGTINSGAIDRYVYGTGATLPTDITKAGNVFFGWYDIKGNKVTEISNTDIGNKSYTAKWIPNGETPYKVEYYLQNVTLDGYDLEESEILSGVAGTLVNATIKDYEGFTKNDSSVTVGTIDADGNTVLVVKYERNTYQVTLNANDGAINDNNVEAYVYGIGDVLPTNVTKVGYNFYGWCDNKGNKITEITSTDIGNKNYYAKWIPDGETPYLVQHYKQADNSSEFYLEETDTLSGTAGTLAIAVRKEYSDQVFDTNNKDNISAGIIAENGSLVLKLYYVKTDLYLNPGRYQVETDSETGKNYIKGIDLNTDAKTVLNEIQSNGSTTIVDKDGNEVDPDKKLSTGDALQITIGSDVRTYKIVIKGDVNGDGLVNATDLLMLKRHIIAGTKTDWLLKDEFFRAGDFDDNKNINATDLLRMKRAVLGK